VGGICEASHGIRNLLASCKHRVTVLSR